MDHHYLSLAEPYYSINTNHFHTYEHAQLVSSNARRIDENLGETNIIKGIVLGAAFHDAGYHHPEAKEFPSKEDYSIYLLTQERETGKLGDISDSDFNIAIQGIEGTKINQEDFEDPARKILRAADINNLGDSYENMLYDALKIYNEYSYLERDHLIKNKLNPLPRELFKEKQCEILKIILKKTKESVPEEYFLHKSFYKKIEQNIFKLSQQTNPFK